MTHDSSDNCGDPPSDFGTGVGKALEWVGQSNRRSFTASNAEGKCCVRLTEAAHPDPPGTVYDLTKPVQMKHVDAAGYGRTWDEAAREAMKA